MILANRTYSELDLFLPNTALKLFAKDLTLVLLSWSPQLVLAHLLWPVLHQAILTVKTYSLVGKCPRQLSTRLPVMKFRLETALETTKKSLTVLLVLIFSVLCL